MKKKKIPFLSAFCILNNAFKISLPSAISVLLLKIFISHCAVVQGNMPFQRSDCNEIKSI